MPAAPSGNAIASQPFSHIASLWAGVASERPELGHREFVGPVQEEVPAVPYAVPEVRRRDIGRQKYASGTPSMNPPAIDRNGLFDPRRRGHFESFETQTGAINLATVKRDLGFLPTADTVLFLRNEYNGSRASVTPQRFFPS